MTLPAENNRPTEVGLQPPPLTAPAAQPAPVPHDDDLLVRRAEHGPLIRVTFDDVIPAAKHTPELPLRPDFRAGQIEALNPAQRKIVLSFGSDEQRAPGRRFTRRTWLPWAVAAVSLCVLAGALLWVLPGHLVRRKGQSSHSTLTPVDNNRGQVVLRRLESAPAAATRVAPPFFTRPDPVPTPASVSPSFIPPTQATQSASASTIALPEVSVPVRPRPVVWVAPGGTVLQPAAAAVFAAMRAQCVLYARSGQLQTRIGHPAKSPLSERYFFRTDDDAFRLDVSKTGVHIEGEPGDISLVQLQNGGTNLVLVVAPLLMVQSPASNLTCSLASPLLELLAPQLEVRLALALPGGGVTNVSGSLKSQEGGTVVDYASLDVLRAWPRTRPSARQDRLLRFQKSLADSVADAVKELNSAERTDGLDLPLVKLALWGVMAPYERATVQEVSRIQQEPERREQRNRNSFYSSTTSNAVHRSFGHNTAPKTSAPAPAPAPTPAPALVSVSRTNVRLAFAQKDAVAAYLAALDVFQNSPTAEVIRTAARKAVVQGVLRELHAFEKTEPILLGCEVSAAGLDGQRVLVMQWSAKK